MLDGLLDFPAPSYQGDRIGRIIREPLLKGGRTIHRLHTTEMPEWPQPTEYVIGVDPGTEPSSQHVTIAKVGAVSGLDFFLSDNIDEGNHE